MKDKKVRSYLIWNIKSGDLKIRKTKPRRGELTPFDMVSKIKLKAKLPKIDPEEISVDFELDKTKIREIIAEELSYTEDGPDKIENKDLSKILYGNSREEIFGELERIKDELGHNKETLELIRSLISLEHRKLNREDILDILEDNLVDVKTKIIENKEDD